MRWLSPSLGILLALSLSACVADTGDSDESTDSAEFVIQQQDGNSDHDRHEGDSDQSEPSAFPLNFSDGLQNNQEPDPVPWVPGAPPPEEEKNPDEP